MNIKIIDKPVKEIKEKIKELYKETKEEDFSELRRKDIDNIKNIISNKEIKQMLFDLQDYDNINKISYIKLSKIEEAARILSQNISNLKKQVELEDFLKKGYNIDIDSLKQRYLKSGLDSRFPTLDFDKIKELYLRPPKTISTNYDESLKINIDDFVFRKYMIAILQMIFNHMDLVIGNIGDEGSGKSCKCSQDMFVLWWLMTQIKLIDYPFDINEIFASTLQRFSELEDKYYGIPFRILGLDEGNELNRQDWKEDTVKLFWQRLRRERHEQRIKFINIPVLGEMIINIVLTRINFIFNMRTKNETKSGTLYKGDYDFYIIPRGDKIYSPYLNTELKKQDIKNKLYTNLKDKEYLKGLPKDIRIKRCHFNGVWGFNEKEYVKKLKETNKQYTVTKGIRFGISELFCFYKANITPGKIKVSKDSIIYPSLRKMIYKVKNYFNNDPELLLKYENIFRQKEEEKLEDGTTERRLFKTFNRDEKIEDEISDFDM